MSRNYSMKVVIHELSLHYFSSFTVLLLFSQIVPLLKIR